MIMYFRPDGYHTERRDSSPLPDKHATATLSWGRKSEFARAATRSPCYPAS